MNVKEIVLEFEMFIQNNIYPQPISGKLAKVLKKIIAETPWTVLKLSGHEEYIYLIAANKDEYSLKQSFFIFNAFNGFPFSFFRDQCHLSLDEYKELCTEQQIHVAKWTELVQPRRAELNRRFQALKQKNMNEGKQQIITSLD